MLFSGIVVAQNQQADDVTRQLFEQYIARQAKISTDSVMAATHLVAERGRASGFWKDVLKELKRNNPNSEIGCVRVLGKMLAIDASARDSIRRHNETGELSAWHAVVRLGPQVVDELIERGGKADRFRTDHYTIALARARTPKARDFFLSILRVPRSSGPFKNAGVHMDGTKFHAAVGLAQLGDSAGIDWLIANAEHHGSVLGARPRGTRPGGGLSACCVEALRQLSGQNGLTSKAEWTEWSKSVDKKLLINRAVVFGDP
ncbi:MAG: hypothetical protein CMJ48_03455 [Planctomycetaceae bacterium]|nr:hypothetical protein [Planctomycetaceae bacterium]